MNALALMVVVEPTKIGFEYAVDEEIGSEPSTVYLMVAPAVSQLRATFWGDEYVLPGGLKVGVATGKVMLYVAEEVSLSVLPFMKAFAFRVVVELKEIGFRYAVDEDMGSDPSVV